MSSLQHAHTGGTASPIARLEHMFDEWFRSLPVRRPSGDGGADEVIRVDEFRDGDTQVVRAELPGIDPAQDVEITVVGRMLSISAERRTEEKSEDEGWTRQELRYGSFSRTLPLPDGATGSDISARYKDGILEVRIPVSRPTAAGEPVRIPVSTG